jgi:hypothetical protein
VQQLAHVRGGERGCAGDALEEDRAEGVQVGAGVDRALEHAALLG